MQEAVGSNGIRLGENARLHPYATADLHWVTNPGMLSPSKPVVSDLLLVAKAGMDGTWEHTTWDLKYLGELDYYNYFGVQVKSSANLSGFAGKLSLSSIINKSSDFVLRLSADEARVNDVGNQTFTQRLLHWITQASAAAEIRPGGGALMLSLQMMYFWDKYDSILNIPDHLLDNWRYIPSVRLSWQFLPKTALFVDAQAQFARFDSVPFPSLSNPSIPDPNTVNVDSDIASFSAGLTGSLTTRVTALLQAGYTNTFTLIGGENLQTATGAAILAFNTDTVKLNGGVVRMLQPASLFRYFTLTRVFLKLDAQVAAHTVLTAGPEYNYMSYATEVTPSGIPRVDDDYVLVASISQALGEWWTLALTDRVNYRTSTFSSAAGTTGYFLNDVFLSLRLRY